MANPLDDDDDAEHGGFGGAGAGSRPYAKKPTTPVIDNFSVDLNRYLEENEHFAYFDREKELNALLKHF